MSATKRQNTSSAVMSQRIEPSDSLDFFPTPPWATRALCEHVLPLMPIPTRLLKAASVWEPACGDGAMARPLAEYFAQVRATDIHDYGFGVERDFFSPGAEGVDWVITNPPFRLGERFAETALAIADMGVALLVRTAFLESATRYRLFSQQPPRIIAQFVERVPMVKGRLSKTASTATAYCWVVWSKLATSDHPIFTWIPPCRPSLERPGDYAAGEVGR
jgi:hypothetical protein